MKNLSLVVFLALTNLSFSQSISNDPPLDYLSVPFGNYALEGEKTEILKIIDRFMLAVNTRSKSIFDEVLYSGINKIITTVDKKGQAKTAVFNNDESISRIVIGNDSTVYRERYWDAVVITEGNIASVWAPYDFYINGEFSHCGVDLFYLVRDEDWKIAHYGYTKTETCNK
jgi:hypothetical protein|tara:strand:- start:538 stop:1050 length:513 start_codon:yes stop_codon:yes gene_type:complete